MHLSYHWFFQLSTFSFYSAINLLNVLTWDRTPMCPNVVIPVYRSEFWHRDNHRLDHNLHYNLYDSGNCNTANPRRRFILLYHFICTIRNPLCRNCISDQYRVTYGCIFNSLQSCISANRTYTFCKKLNLLDEAKLRK